MMLSSGTPGKKKASPPPPIYFDITPQGAPADKRQIYRAVNSPTLSVSKPYSSLADW